MGIGTGEDYINLANTVLLVQAKIVQPDGTNIADADPFGPVNLWLHGLFSQVDISLNGTQVTTLTNTYPYCAMMETLLSYGDETKMSQLTLSLFFKAQLGRMAVVDFAEAARNIGLWSRSRFTRGSHVVDMIGRIHADIFFQNRYLLNEVNVKIKLVRSRNSFCLMTANANQFMLRSSINLVIVMNIPTSLFFKITVMLFHSSTVILL